MKRTLRIAGIMMLVLGVGISSYLFYMYSSVKETISSIYEPIQPHALSPMSEENSEVAALEQRNGDPPLLEHALEEKEGEAALSTHSAVIDLKKKEPFTILLLGVDERSKDRGRSDTIVVLGVNPAKKSVMMFNIPRDTRTEIVGKGFMDKINHAYAFGGIQMSVQTVENFLNIPINYYVKVNMEGFENIINIFGGIEVDNPFAFTYEGIHYPEGKVFLDGHHALMYSRMRYDDPKGDIGRNSRQQSILAKLINRAQRISTLTKWTDILDQIKANAKTNLTMDDMTDLFERYRNEIDSIDKEGILGTDGYVNNVYYYIVDKKERERMHELLVEHLE